MTQTIPLTKGKVAVVDDDDYPTLAQFKWTYSEEGYAYRQPQKGTVLMHRFIMQAPKGMVVDHIDRDGLNNQRANLRICTQAGNIQHSHNKGGTKGTYFNTKRGHWQAHINANGKHQYLGKYATQEEAARAYDDAAREYFGEYASTNY